MTRKTILFLASYLISTTCHANIIANWSSINESTDVATGMLGSNAFTLTVTTLRSQVYGDGGIRGGVVGGVHTGNNANYGAMAGIADTAMFDSPYFTPSIPYGDRVDLGASSDFRLQFASPVTGLILDLYGLGDTQLNFTTDGNAGVFSLLSSDGDFSVLNGSTSILGIMSFNDSNGSLFFHGTINELAWSSNHNNPGDGFSIQLAQLTAVPEPSSFVVFLLGAIGFVAFTWQRRRRRMAL